MSSAAGGGAGGATGGVMTGGAGVVVEIGCATQNMPGFALCGDAWTWAPRTDGVLLVVVDGLGHGDDAAVAAGMATALVQAHKDADLPDLVTRCHEGLKRSRGVVMSAAIVDATGLWWTGIGNVEGIVARGPQGLGGGGTRDALSCRGGVVGYKLPALKAWSTTFADADTLVMCTDGVKSGFQPTLDDAPVQELADRLLRDFASGDDDALVVVLRRAPAAPAAGAGAVGTASERSSNIKSSR